MFVVGFVCLFVCFLLLVPHTHSIKLWRKNWWLDGYFGNTKLKWSSSCLTWIIAEVK